MIGLKNYKLKLKIEREGEKKGKMHRTTKDQCRSRGLEQL